MLNFFNILGVGCRVGRLRSGFRLCSIKHNRPLLVSGCLRVCIVKAGRVRARAGLLGLLAWCPWADRLPRLHRHARRLSRRACSFKAAAVSGLPVFPVACIIKRGALYPSGCAAAGRVRGCLFKRVRCLLCVRLLVKRSFP